MDMFNDTMDATDGIRVGIGGWTFAPWRDNFYPKGLVQRRELEFASRHVTAIEINGTYYGTQKPATYAKWRDEAPDGFVFSMKGPRFATNRKVLAEAGTPLSTRALIEAIGEHDAEKAAKVADDHLKAGAELAARMGGRTELAPQPLPAA